MEPQQIFEKLSLYLVLLFSLSVHESAHAWTALRMGDETGMREGRISLNPLVHIDPIGTVFFPLLLLFFSPGFLFGWAKPVPVQPRNFRQYRKGQILTAGAGPISNFLLALLFTGVYGVAIRAAGSASFSPVVDIAWMGIWLNVVLGVFNLIPVPPLDGSWIVSWGLPRRIGDVYDRIGARYGYLILMLLFISGALGVLMSRIVGPIISFLGYLARTGINL